MGFQEIADRLGFVRREVIEDDVDLLPGPTVRNYCIPQHIKNDA
jgi:hypothetical protein